jgi:hypothetical protein
MIEAKKIRKQHPRKFKTWNEYVAYASKLVSKKSKAKRPAGHKHKTIKKAVMPKKVVHKKAIKKVSRIGASEGAVLRQIERTKAEIKKLEKMQEDQMLKRHKTAIVGAIKKKHVHLKSLLKKY